MVCNGLGLRKGFNYALIIWWIIVIWNLLGKDKFVVCEKSLCKRFYMGSIIEPKFHQYSLEYIVQHLAFPIL